MIMSSAYSGVSQTGKKDFFFWSFDPVSLICHKFVHDYIAILKNVLHKWFMNFFSDIFSYGAYKQLDSFKKTKK